MQIGMSALCQERTSRKQHGPAVTDVGSTRCKISTRAWPFGKYLWLRVLCLRNGMGAPNFLGSPKITVRLGHQFAFFHLVARGSRAGIHLPRPVPQFVNIFHTLYLAGQAATRFAPRQFGSCGKLRTSLCPVCDANGLVALLAVCLS